MDKTKVIDLLDIEDEQEKESLEEDIDAVYRDSIMSELSMILSGRRDADKPESNFGAIAMFWNDYLSLRSESRQCLRLTPKDVAIMMALMKIARFVRGRKPGDSLVDLAGYAVCAATMQRVEEDTETEDFHG